MFKVSHLMSHHAERWPFSGQLWLQMGSWDIFNVPDPKQIAASIVKTAGEIDELHLAEGPR